MDNLIVILCYVGIALILYVRKKQQQRVYTPGGLIYEDELDELKKYINVLDIEYKHSESIDEKEIKKYAITLYYHDREKLHEIMTNGFKYSVRKR